MKLICYLGCIAFLLISCTPQKSNNSAPPKEDNSIKALFTTTQGTFTAVFRPEWGPIGVARIRELIESEFYTDMAIFRVAKDYVVQFGISNDTSLNSHWMGRQLKDEPVLQPNKQWTISFARDGANTRDTQIFINLKNNSPRLDTINYMDCRGFPVIGEVIEGTETISKFYSGYGNAPSMEQDSIYARGNAYLKEKYPELDYLVKVEIVEK